MEPRSLSRALCTALLAAACAPAADPAGPSGAAGSPAGDVAPGATAAAESTGELEANLARARERWQADPTDEDAIVWYGRRLAYLGRYHEAEQVYTRGLELHPESHRLRRHRGHRLISMRRFEEAARDLAQAARLIEGVPDAVEPDGMPNEHGVPRSTTHSNIHYHLGLAWYLQGNFERAERAWADGLEFARANDDMLCATSYWLYLARRRLDDAGGAAAVLAPVRADMEILENHAYHDLLRLFRGDLDAAAVLDAADGPVDRATRAYGVGAWRLVEGDREGALALFEEAQSTDNESAFGYIAAEAELRRLR